ncbi:MAG: hypothetical protein ACKERF_00585 [Candidatus Hodgkinia cicadicola]
MGSLLNLDKFKTSSIFKFNLIPLVIVSKIYVLSLCESSSTAEQ